MGCSKGSLEAALMQSQQPIAFASRALTDTERGFTQVEKELQAVVFGMGRFQFTVEHNMDVQSDYMPLESIMKNPLLSAPK